MISASNLSMRFGSKILFKAVDLQLNPGQHYGLVGANGSGKSTLIKILINDISSETGSISIPSQVSVGTLKQDHFLYETTPILHAVLRGKPRLWSALEQKELLLKQDAFDETLCEELDKAEKTIAEHSGYSASSEAAKLLEGLGIYAETHLKPMSILSGGYKLRVLLAQVLFSDPDVLLLDEPTNHLDIFSIKWLEGYLRNFPGTLLISSHDWDFLNTTCNNILDLDYQTIRCYKGNYEAFLVTKAADKEQKLSTLAKQEKKKEGMQTFIDRFGAKATKARQAQSKAKLVQKLEEEISSLGISASSRAYPRITFDEYRPAGATVLALKAIHKHYGEKKVLEDISFEVERGDRIAILGANGIGKSTLLEIITKHAEPQEGSFQWGFAVQHAYFPQNHQREVHGKVSVLDWMRQFDREIPEQKLRDILGRMLFSGDDVNKSVDILSGGETARLIIAKMILMKHNVLVFDEPTNHLDMESTEALLEALQEYPGTIIFVSHNRHFISSLANRIIEITKEGLKDFKCDYVEYMEKRDLDLLSTKHHPRKAELDGGKNKEDQKNRFEEKKNLRNLRAQLEKKVKATELKCHQLEEKLKEVEKQLGDVSFYQDRSRDEQQVVLKKKVELEQQLESALEEWEVAGTELSKL